MAIILCRCRNTRPDFFVQTPRFPRWNMFREYPHRFGLPDLSVIFDWRLKLRSWQVEPQPISDHLMFKSKYSSISVHMLPGFLLVSILSKQPSQGVKAPFFMVENERIVPNKSWEILRDTLWCQKISNKNLHLLSHLKKRGEIRIKTAFRSQSLVAKNHHVLESFPNHYHHNMLVHKELKSHVQHPYNYTRTGGDHDLENTQKYSNVGTNTCCMHLNSCECWMQMNMLKIQLLRYFNRKKVCACWRFESWLGLCRIEVSCPFCVAGVAWSIFTRF